MYIFAILESCSLEKERGPCKNYTVNWFYDMEYGGCSRFWYGGCEGNDNNFRSQDECKDVCVEPQGKGNKYKLLNIFRTSSVLKYIFIHLQ